VLSNAQSPAARQRVSKPTTREIPTVTLTNLPVVTYASFEPYIASIGPDYDRHRRFKKGVLEEHIRIGSRETSVIPSSSFTDLIDTKLLASMSTSNLSTGSLDETLHSPSSVQPSPRRRLRNRDDEPESLDTVPPVFFDPNFSLSNPRTFDIVNENSELLTRTVTAGKPDRKSLASNAILQEKLSWYMDIVEVHLIKEINTASTSFFAALSDLQDLNEDASRCVAKIGRIREELAGIQEVNASGGEEVTRLHIQRANVARLQKTVDLVGKIAKIRDQIEDHLERKENSQAYQLMQDIKGMMESSETESSINLRRVEALRNIDAEMASVLSRIGTSQGNDLTKTLVTDLRSWVNSTNTQATFRRLSDTFNRDTTQRRIDPNLLSPAHVTVPEDLRATVILQLHGLQQSRFLETGMDLYHKEIVKEVRGVIKKNLPSTEDDTESVMSSATNQPHNVTQDRKEKSAAIAKNLRQMAPEVFLEMIMTTYASLLEFFRRLQTHQKLLLDLTALSASGTGETVVPADLSEVLLNIMDISFTRIQKILGVRADQNSHLHPREFYVFLASTRLFSLECERISGRTPTVLMATVNSQARVFVSWLHLDRTKFLGNAVDKDKWKSEDVLAVTQKQTSLLAESATRDPSPWARFIHVDSPENLNGISDAKAVEKTLAIEDERFFVVGCVVVLLGILEEYCIAMIALPRLQSDIAANLIELLKVPKPSGDLFFLMA
jgi:vacuolar protein sorting-associated protein 54